MQTLIPTPVKLRNREDGWTPARQWEFLQVLGDTASVKDAAARVGMSERSAHRLRRHPEAEAFRIAWDAALALVWQRVEQVALDRVVNGDIDVIEREGRVVATRRRPCSERLMIHMLTEQRRRLEAQAAAMAAELAAARAELLARRRHDDPEPAVVAPDRVAAETGALRALHNRTQALPDAVGWDVEACDLGGAAPAVPMPEKLLAPASGRIGVKLRAARVRDAAHPASPKVRNKPPAADFPILAPRAEPPRFDPNDPIPRHDSPRPAVWRLGD